MTEQCSECGKKKGFLGINRRMEELCVAAYDRGERTTLRQAIDELRASLPRPTEGVDNE